MQAAKAEALQAVRHPSSNVKRILAGLRSNGFALVRGGDPRTPSPSPTPPSSCTQARRHLRCRYGALAPVARPVAAGSVPGLRSMWHNRRPCLHSSRSTRSGGWELLALLYPSPIPLVPPTSPQPRLRITPPISHTRTHCLHSSSYGATTGRVSRPNAMPNPSLWPHPSPSPHTNPNPNPSCGTSITPNCSRKPGVGR